jgi:hypothetical protein
MGLCPLMCGRSVTFRERIKMFWGSAPVQYFQLWMALFVDNIRGRSPLKIS